MLFKLRRSVPSNTTKTSPDWRKLKITKGTITQWIVFQPIQASNLCQFRVEYHGTHILPVTPHEYLYGFFKATVFEDNIKIDGAPYELDIFAFNDDTKFAHEYNLYVNVFPEKAYTPAELSEEDKAALEALLGET